ncbi:MAG: FxsA family protein [Sulfuricurvum sp.]|nr:FxsA family protein [Sulfuricurvum sp.]MDD5386549.1 FxsA family protein [Sulfuricurvum sp.]
MIYFLLYLFCEVLLTVEVASRLGGLMMFAEIVMSAFIGIGILFNFRATLVTNIMELKERRLDANGFYQRNLLSLLGAIFLILPGVLTDIIGILIQFSLLVGLIINRFKPKYPPQNNPTYYSKDDNVIDAEIISDSPSLR